VTRIGQIYTNAIYSSVWGVAVINIFLQNDAAGELRVERDCGWAPKTVKSQHRNQRMCHNKAVWSSLEVSPPP